MPCANCESLLPFQKKKKTEVPFTSEVYPVSGSRAGLQEYKFKLLKQNTKLPVFVHPLPHCAKPQWDALPSPESCSLQG